MIDGPGAVIFDCDGVLVDSEGLMNREFRTMLGEIGLSYTSEETTRTFMGRSMKSCLQIVETQLGRAVPDDFLAVLDERAYAVFARDLKPVDGIEALLDSLDAEAIPYAVASSGSHEKMRTTLGITGLLPRLAGRITSATEVAHGKPAPDVFLLAAERLRTEPARCVVIEDSLLGIEAARAADMRVIGYAAMVSPEAMQAAGATHVVEHMRDVMELLAGM
ncbi:MAG: HAD family phosphatase [Gemmatimonadaceae bacterium]|nr:HAD family phosphatase [Gemmatimonadaceae bacterium]